MNFLQASNCFKQENVVSAQRAVDFYNGDQKRLLKQTLAKDGLGIKNYASRGVMPLVTSYTKKVIERSAHTYDDQPKRQIVVNGEVDEAQTELYNYILEQAEFEFESQGIDEMSRLLKTAIALVQWVESEGKYSISLLSRHNCEVEYNRAAKRINSLMYSDCDPGKYGGQMFRYITPETIDDFEVVFEEKAKEPTIKDRVTVENPYGIMPTAVLFDVRAPDYGFWHKPAWDELVDFNEALNMMNTEIKFGSRFSFMGALFTNANIPEGVVINPDAIISIQTDDPETPVYLEYKAPQVQVDSFQNWLDGYARNVGQNWGVKLEAEGQGMAESGFKLVVEEIPSLELRKTRQKAAIPFERQLFQVIKTMHAIDSPADQQFSPDAELWVDFKEPSMPVKKLEEWNIAKEQIALGVLSREDYLRSQDPDLTPEEIEEKLAKIDAGRTVEVNTPEFDE